MTGTVLLQSYYYISSSSDNKSTKEADFISQLNFSARVVRFYFLYLLLPFPLLPLFPSLPFRPSYLFLYLHSLIHSSPFLISKFLASDFPHYPLSPSLPSLPHSLPSLLILSPLPAFLLPIPSLFIPSLPFLSFL